MALPLFGGPRLIRPNVVLETQTETTDRDAAGGSVAVWTSRATGIRAMYTLVKGGRPGDFHAENERTGATFRAAAGTIGRADLRLKVTAVLDASLAFLVGTYWRVEATQNEPAGLGGLLPASDGAQCSNWEVLDA